MYDLYLYYKTLIFEDAKCGAYKNITHMSIALQSNLPERSPLLKGHFFHFPVIEYFMGIEPLLRGHLSEKTTFSFYQR